MPPPRRTRTSELNTVVRRLAFLAEAGALLDDGLRGERSADQVVLQEKAREDWVRGVTGWRVVRVTSEHMATLDAAESHFRAVGLFARRSSRPLWFELAP